MIVVDASVLIAHLDERDVHHARAEAMLLEAADQPLGASPITLAEVLVGPTRRGRLDAARDALRTLDITEIPLGPDAAARLAGLRARTGLRMPDCCVLLAMEDGDAEGILTLDERLGRSGGGEGEA